MTQIKEAYSNVKGQAKAALQKAKSLSKNCTPEDEAFDEFRQAYESLSADFRQLQEEKQQLVAKIDCLNTADDDEMREYEERVEVQNRKWFLLQFVFNIFVVDQRYAREHRPGPPRGEQDIVEDGRAARGVVGSAPRARLADQRQLLEGFREDGLRRRGLRQPGRRREGVRQVRIVRQGDVQERRAAPRAEQRGAKRRRESGGDGGVHAVAAGADAGAVQMRRRDQSRDGREQREEDFRFVGGVDESEPHGAVFFDHAEISAEFEVLQVDDGAHRA
jgi:hypothetical protein